MRKKDVWIIIPAYNEEKNIANTIKDILKLGHKIVVIDDGSTDKTFDIASKFDIFALKHLVNLGNGAAKKTGIEFAINNGAKYIVLMDADGQHKASDVPKLLQKLKKVDIVFGTRKQNNHMPLRFRVGNWGLSILVWVMFGIRVSDTQTGFKAFRADVYEEIKWDSSRYSVETEMITKVSKHKLKYATIRIATIYLDAGKGTTVFDGFKIFYDMLLWRLARK